MLRTRFAFVSIGMCSIVFSGPIRWGLFTFKLTLSTLVHLDLSLSVSKCFQHFPTRADTFQHTHSTCSKCESVWMSATWPKQNSTKPNTYKAIQSLAADTLLRELRDVILLRSWKVHENSMNRWANHSAEACFNKVRNGPMLETLVTLTCACSFQLVKTQPAETTV